MVTAFTPFMLLSQAVPRGFTTLTVIKNLEKQDRKTIFTGKKMKFELPKQFFLPMLAGLRADIKYDDVNGRVGWFQKPEEVFDKAKNAIAAALMRTYKTTYHSELNRASKDSNLWTILYSIVERTIDKSKEWKMYDAPR